LLQKQVAEQIGVDTTTVYNWERNETSPQIHVMPEVIRFLGRNPLPSPRSFAEKLKTARKELGLTQKALAKRLGIDSTTLARWGRGKTCPSKKLGAVVEGLLWCCELQRK
jgi:DNA-binding XRE family transcriptional regulator